MFLIGVCYGATQNLTLVLSFSAVPRRHHNLASAVWNVGFDGGTAMGSVVVGLIGAHELFHALLCAGAVAGRLPLAMRLSVALSTTGA